MNHGVDNQARIDWLDLKMSNRNQINQNRLSQQKKTNIHATYSGNHSEQQTYGVGNIFKWFIVPVGKKKYCRDLKKPLKWT